MFDIIIPFYQGHKTIDKLIQSISSNINIIIVDDHSDRPLKDLNYPNVTILKGNKKGYFAGAVNIGIKHSKKDILILNQDIYFTGDGWITQIENALDDGYSYIGERIQGVREDWPFGYIHGTFMYMSREMINKTGLLNSSQFPMWGCTAEYQLRAARNNFKIKPLETVKDFVHVREGSLGESFQSLVSRERNKRSLFLSTPPLLSVVIPTHNFSSWMEETVNSLVGGMTSLGMWEQQTFAAFEVVIVDDSSTDDTPEILKRVCNPWKGIRSIRLDRPRPDVWDDVRDKYIGKVKALNAGIEAAYGDYIIVLDADDMMKSDRLEKMFKAQLERPHGFIYDNLQFFGEGKIKEYTYPQELLVIKPGGKAHRKPHPKFGETTNVFRLDQYNFETLIYKNHVHFSIMFPKKAWKAVGGYPKRFKYGREDWAMAVLFGLNGYCGHRLARSYAGLLYRREGQNRTIENSRPKWMRYFQSSMKKQFKELYEGVRPMGCCGRGARSNNGNNRNQAFAAGNNNARFDGDSVWVRYTGRRSRGERFTLYGYSTGTPYRVTPGTDFRVAVADLTAKDPKAGAVLDYFEGNSYAFEVVQQETVVAKVEPEPNESVTVSVVQEAEEILDTSVLDGNLSVFYGALENNDYTASELELLAAYERGNSNRTGALNAINSALGVLGAEPV